MKPILSDSLLRYLSFTISREADPAARKKISQGLGALQWLNAQQRLLKSKGENYDLYALIGVGLFFFFFIMPFMFFVIITLIGLAWYYRPFWEALLRYWDKTRHGKDPLATDAPQSRTPDGDGFNFGPLKMKIDPRQAEYFEQMNGSEAAPEQDHYEPPAEIHQPEPKQPPCSQDYGEFSSIYKNKKPGDLN